MAAQKLQRTTHRDPLAPGNPVRTGNVSHAEAARDMDQYDRPLEQVHAGATLHGWGIAAGLQVTATLNAPDLRVLAGVALDATGRHISLAEGGTAEIGQNAEAPGATPMPAAVTPTGVVIPTAGLTGAKFVTIQFLETFDNDAYLTLGVYRYDHTPWIRLLDAAGFVDDGTRIVLARVTFGAGAAIGNVTGVTEQLRRGVDLPAESIHLRRSQVTGAGTRIEHTDSGEIRSIPSGGIELKTPHGIQMTTPRVAVRRSDGVETIVINTDNANIIAGTNGVEGDVVVLDSHGRMVITLDGSDASLVVGANGNEGDILVKNSQGQNSMRVDGGTGTTLTTRLAPIRGDGVLDVDTRFFRIHGWDLCLDGRSGGNKRALVDLGNRLVVNFAGDYAAGVDINRLHLDQHIRTENWFGQRFTKNPIYGQWIPLFEIDTGLPAAEWKSTTMCTVGMNDDGSVEDFFWGLANASYVNGGGNIVIRWDVAYADRGDDWWPWVWDVMMVAVRR